MTGGRGRPQWLRDVQRVDEAVYAAVASTPTPALDAAMRRLSGAADGSKLWMGAAAAMCTLQGPPGRRAAVMGLSSVAATSAVVNGLVKPLARRRRPDRVRHGVPLDRHVEMPTTRSFPSGHAASAFAFAGGAGHVLPMASVPLHLMATAVTYSRVHVGVHFPGDTVLGAVLGTAGSQLITHAIDRRRR